MKLVEITWLWPQKKPVVAGSNAWKEKIQELWMKMMPKRWGKMPNSKHRRIGGAFSCAFSWSSSPTKSILGNHAKLSSSNWGVFSATDPGTLAIDPTVTIRFLIAWNLGTPGTLMVESGNCCKWTTDPRSTGKNLDKWRLWIQVYVFSRNMQFSQVSSAISTQRETYQEKSNMNPNNNLYLIHIRTDGFQLTLTFTK